MHLPDFYIIKPVFVDDVIEGYVSTLAHPADVGGIAPGGMAVYATEVYQEGLRIPALKLYEAGKPNQAILRLIEKNSRRCYIFNSWVKYTNLHSNRARRDFLASSQATEFMRPSR